MESKPEFTPARDEFKDIDTPADLEATIEAARRPRVEELTAECEWKIDNLKSYMATKPDAFGNNQLTLEPVFAVDEQNRPVPEGQREKAMSINRQVLDQLYEAHTIDNEGAHVVDDLNEPNEVLKRTTYLPTREGFVFVETAFLGTEEGKAEPGATPLMFAVDIETEAWYLERVAKEAR